MKRKIYLEVNGRGGDYIDFEQRASLRETQNRLNRTRRDMHFSIHRPSTG